MSLLDGTMIQRGNKQVAWDRETFCNSARQSYMPLSLEDQTPTICEFCLTTSKTQTIKESDITHTTHTVNSYYHTCILVKPNGAHGIYDTHYGSFALAMDEQHLAINIQYMLCDECHYKIIDAYRTHYLIYGQNIEPYLVMGETREEMVKHARVLMNDINLLEPLYSTRETDADVEMYTN